ncbi:unnamed protein product [Spirodela intermedia]|uniref:Uncharacterized protein n=1 Tax=Spirodela intermedia TaxID=51605 RepID=A0A7I8J7P1_SPIIN|nr:unnamed protein product [Spirodela intermedia]CAA6666256.1 unnamed protein product [Spirodela intermedia]
MKSEKVKVEGKENHVRLIRTCLGDLLEAKPSRTPRWKAGACPDEGDRSACREFLSRGELDATALSGFLSGGSFFSGLQLHAFSVKAGLDRSCPVASALIKLYAGNGGLHHAHQLFDEMIHRSTTSWTAMIAGYAQNSQLQKALQLFIQMRQSSSKPNDYTLSSLLSACAGAGCLYSGKVLHCQGIQMGFSSHPHVSNSLISMYAKCGSIDDGSSIFNQMATRDIVSWNSMISGYAQHGLAAEARVPDGVTFLGVLSSCRHAGLVDLARRCFNSMPSFGLNPELGHYSCIVDLLGRAGQVEEALDFIERMPVTPNGVIWGSLLSSCRVHGNTCVGIRAAEGRLGMEPGCAATHVQLANLYATVGDWRRAAKVRKEMKERGVKTVPGYSWIEVGGEVHMFRAEDGSNTHLKEMISVLDSLFDQMRSFGHESMTDSDSQEEPVQIGPFTSNPRKNISRSRSGETGSSP